jgi:hypothetical protein
VRVCAVVCSLLALWRPARTVVRTVKGESLFDAVGLVALSRFHISCLKLSDMEYSFFMVEGESTYICVLCVVSSRRSRDKTPIRNLRFASTSELPTKVVSPE